MSPQCLLVYRAAVECRRLWHPRLSHCRVQYSVCPHQPPCAPPACCQRGTALVDQNPVWDLVIEKVGMV